MNQYSIRRRFALVLVMTLFLLETYHFGNVQMSLAAGVITSSAVSSSGAAVHGAASGGGITDVASGGGITDVASGGGISDAASGGAVTVSPSPSPVPTASQVPSDLSTIKVTTPKSVSVRGGSKRVRVSWKAVSDADGYYIYSRPSSSAAYTKVKTIEKATTVSYDKTGLEQNTTYYFCVSSYKMINGVTFESGLSTAVYAKTKAATKTSKGAKKYNTKAKFKKSPAYKKYKNMVKALNYSKSFAIPGMINTNVGGFNCTNMVPQGITLAGSYFLITAYDSKGADYSVIYVVSRASKSYITTIILPSKAKVGGIAYDGTNVWVSKGSKVASFPYSFVTDTVNAGVAYKKLTAYNTTNEVYTTASYMGYYNGILWVGAYKTSSSTMYGYKVGNVLSTPTLTQKYTMSVPGKTQGITFDADGTLILTRGCGKNPTVSGYVSQIRTYMPSYDNAGESGKVLKNTVRKTTKMPPKTEGVAIYGAYTYTLFSSSHFGACKYPVDRVLSLKTAKLLS